MVRPGDDEFVRWVDRDYGGDVEISLECDSEGVNLVTVNVCVKKPGVSAFGGSVDRDYGSGDETGL